MANFIRKNNHPNGRYEAAFKSGVNDAGTPIVEETIRIEGREVYSTDDKKKIDFVRNDPEIMEISKKTQIETNEEE